MKKRSIMLVVTTISFITFFGHGCSRDPLEIFYEKISGPYSEQVGPYSRITFYPGPDRYPVWSGDGTQIMYSARGFEQKTQGQGTINLIPYSGGISRRISPVWARGDENMYPCWLNNGRQVAYISFRGTLAPWNMAPTLNIVSVDDITEYSENLLGFHSPLDMAVSPDGNSVIYSDFLDINWYEHTGFRGRTGEELIYPRESRTSDSWTGMWFTELPFSGSERRIFGTEGAQGLSWSPNSDSIALSSEGIIYVTSPLGGTPRELFEGESPAWSPDGLKMACVINGNIFVYRMSDGHRTQITTEGGLDPAWSPDGEKLAFSWAKDGGDYNFDIYVLRLNDVLPRAERHNRTSQQ